MDAWQQGKFGNPVLSNPKVNILRQMCLEFLPQAMGVIKEISLNGEEEKNRFAASRFISEQAGGKAPQSVEIKITDGLSPNMMSSEQLRLYATGRTQEFVISLHKTGKLDEILRSHQLSLENKSLDDPIQPKD